jgi:hypothetical protein
MLDGDEGYRIINVIFRPSINLSMNNNKSWNACIEFYCTPKMNFDVGAYTLPGA